MKYWLILIGFVMSMFVINSVQGATFTVVDGDKSSFIVMNGDTVKGDADRLRAAYNQAVKGTLPFSSNLFLNGSGGSVGAMREVVKLIKAFYLNTIVSGTDKCYSACATTWAAGVNRTMFEGATIGFHFGYQPIEALRQIQDEWGYNGLRQRLVSSAFQEAAYDLHYLNLKDPVQYFLNISQTAPWSFWEITLEEAEEIFGATTL